MLSASCVSSCLGAPLSLSQHRKTPHPLERVGLDSGLSIGLRDITLARPQTPAE